MCYGLLWDNIPGTKVIIIMRRKVCGRSNPSVAMKPLKTLGNSLKINRHGKMVAIGLLRDESV